MGGVGATIGGGRGIAGHDHMRRLSQAELQYIRETVIPASDIISGIIARVSAETGVDPALIRGRCKTADVSAARHAVMAGAREHGLSYPLIGLCLDRDHTTVVHGVQQHRARVESLAP